MKALNVDEIVKAAMARWPHVPACHGWLALDRRGRWRMRDLHAQQAGLPGEPILHAALTAFINRNYLRMDDGSWAFQNGPQRVYVDLENTPLVLHHDPALKAWVSHHGQAIDAVRAALCDESGHLYLDTPAGLGEVCDRDLGVVLAQLIDASGQPAQPESPEALMNLRWRAELPRGATVCLSIAPVQRAELPARFGYVRTPRGTDASSLRV